MTPQLNKTPKRKKLRKSVWMPCLLTVYLLGMTTWFAPQLIANGETARLVTVFLSEVFIIVLLRIFLVKRERQQEERK